MTNLKNTIINLGLLYFSFFILTFIQINYLTFIKLGRTCTYIIRSGKILMMSWNTFAIMETYLFTRTLTLNRKYGMYR